MPKKELARNKTKNLVSISSVLAIILLIHFVLCLDSKAENVQILKLNKNITKQNNIKFEKVGAPLECISQVCFKRPNDIAVASDGSFILVVDSGNLSDSTIYLRKINPPFDQSSKSEFIPLIQKSTEVTLLTIILSQNNKKAAVYREPIETEETLVQIVDLTTNSVKELMSVTSKGLQIGAPVFLDPEGSKLLASTLDPNSPELVTIDSATDEIVNKVSLPDTAQSIHVSPSFKKAVITYRNIFAQSISIYDLQSNVLSRLDIDPSLSFSIDDFLGRADLDLSGNRALISSLGGAHVLHFLDIGNNKLKSLILDKTSEGPTLGAITPDGMTAFAVGSLLDFTVGFKIYKLNLSNDGSISLINSALFDDGSIVLDIDITPDQSKVLVLVLKEDKKQLKILSTKDLSKISELIVANDNAQSFLLVEPNGRFAVSPNTNLEASISVITSFNLGAIFRSIVPNIASVNGGTPFTINGFIDLSRFSEDVKVCFKNNDFCTTSLISRNGQTITGITPKFPSPGFEDLILNTKSRLDGLIRSTKYEGVFQFKKEATIADTFAPEITIFAPKDSVFFNTRRILVFGRVDGTGSLVDSVQVNGEKALLNTEGQISPNIVNFISDLQFKSDGTFQITVNAKDKANNTSEKSVKVAIDTLIPQITANVESTPNIGIFKVTGTVNGTGSNVASITVNSIPVTFTEGEVTNFTVDTSVLPVVITVIDRAGNKNTVNISNPLLEDKTPPTITTISPTSGQIFTDQANISISFTVTDNASVKEVTFNGAIVTAISGNQFSQNITLKSGENSIPITATDTNNNKSAITIKVTYIPSQITETPTTKPQGVSVKDLPGEKEVITIPPDFENLNETLIDQFTQISAGIGELIDISSTLSVEISNPPLIPEGAPGSIEVPEVEGLKPLTTPEETPEIPKGFSFATNVALSDDASGNIVVSNEALDKQNAVVLVDSTGRTFVVGFAFFKELGNNTVSRNLNRKYKFQTIGGQPLDLITTFTVPGDAIEGDATVSILSKNESIATIPLRISPSKEVKVGKRTLAKPQINEPIIATVKKSGTELILKIKGRNFIGRIATIDGDLQRLIGKTRFFTNITFVPSEGITIKELKVVSKKKIVLKAEIGSNIKPGVKLFNVITPKGADIGGIIFPDPIVDGNLETTSSPVSLILESP